MIGKLCAVIGDLLSVTVIDGTLAAVSQEHRNPSDLCLSTVVPRRNLSKILSLPDEISLAAVMGYRPSSPSSFDRSHSCTLSPSFPSLTF